MPNDARSARHNTPDDDRASSTPRTGHNDDNTRTAADNDNHGRASATDDSAADDGRARGLSPDDRQR